MGSRFGQNNWPESSRTLEGSAAVFFSSLVALVFTACVLSSTSEGDRNFAENDGIDPGWWKACTSLAWPVALASLVEAFTRQVNRVVQIAWFSGDKFTPGGFFRMTVQMRSFRSLEQKWTFEQK